MIPVASKLQSHRKATSNWPARAGSQIRVSDGDAIRKAEAALRRIPGQLDSRPRFASELLSLDSPRTDVSARDCLVKCTFCAVRNSAIRAESGLRSQAICGASLADRDARELPSRTISSTFRGVRSTVTLPCGNCGGSEFRSARPRDQLDQRECLRTEIIQGPHTDCSSNLLSGPCFAHAEQIWSLALRTYPIFWLALGCMRMLEVCQIPSGRAGFRQGEYGSRLPFHLQGAQGVTGIGLVAEAIAVAGRCLPVHPAKIVEGQETTCIHRYPHVLSVDFR